ncbi:hypothetical protein [Antrihabitans spumae]|uniref:Uncharacterized protein n=1 Tax=Antrihabitans spumae TaxID=3373370 RepID=A0ABW7K920_9NOCA
MYNDNALGAALATVRAAAVVLGDEGHTATFSTKSGARSSANPAREVSDEA